MAILQKNRTKVVVFLGVIISVTLYTYSSEYLTDKGYKTGNIMAIRGTTALIIASLYGLYTKMRLFPNVLKPQILRFFVNGFASYFSVISFTYLSATNIGLINRLDIPALIILAVMIGQSKSGTQFWLSIWTMIIIGFLALDASFIDEESIGFVYAFISVFLVSAGYLLVQKTSNSESPITLNNVFSLSNLTFGLIISFINKENLHLNVSDLPMIVLGATGQVIIYFMAVKLYSWYSVEKARLPYVLSTVSIALFEMVYEGKVFNINQIGLFLIIAGLLLTIILNPGVPKRNLRTLFARYFK